MSRYSRAEEEFLIANAEEMTVRELADELARSYGSVSQKLRNMGLQSVGFVHQRSVQEILDEISREVFAEVGIRWRSLV
jgi:DNA-binding transcriptional regulator GbsR (MarR family)